MISGANEEELELANARADILLLQQENEELKKQLKQYSKDYCNVSKVKHNYAKKLVIIQNQQQEFIKYMKNIIKGLECENVDDEEMRGYLFQRIDTFKEILQKYKEIIGAKDE